MKKTEFILVAIFLFVATSLFAESEIKIKELKVTNLKPLFEPIIIDSLDVNKKAYDKKSLLQTSIDFSLVRESASSLISDQEGIFSLPFAEEKQDNNQANALQLMSFTIDADRLCKATLNVTATDCFELYVNGKKEKSKEEKQDSLSNAKKITIDLTLEPKRHEVIIKRLAQQQKEDEASMKISLEPKKGFEDVEFIISSDSKRRVTINDIIEGNRLRSGSLSPSGKFYIIHTKDVWPGGKGRDEIQLRELKTNRLVYRFSTAINPSWFHKEDKFIYSKSGITNRDLFVFDVNTLEEKQIAKDIKFDYFTISPTNDFLILSQREEIPADKGDLKRLLDPSDRSGAFRGRSSIYLLRLDDESITQRLTFGKTSIRVNDIAKDGKKALISSSDFVNDRPFSSTTLMELDLSTLNIDTLAKSNFISGGKYSPDGKKLLITGGAEAFDGIGLKIKEGQISNYFDKQAYIYDLQSREVTPITIDFDPSIDSYQWMESDNSIYFKAQVKDKMQVYRYDLKTSTFSLLPLPEYIISSFQLSNDGKVALFRGESSTNAYRLYSYDTKSQKSTLIADPFADQLNQLNISDVTPWSFDSSTGMTIEGFYCLPYDYDITKQYPMIVYYYGGTNPTSRVFESSYPLQVYASSGYVVLVLNPSGTTGWGQEFSARHVNAWGKYTADEIIEGTKKFCEEHPFVNSKKIGCMGASYGGFMTQYLITRTDVFAAAVSHAGISNIASYWGEGFWGYSYGSIASADSYPWNNQDLYVGQSPLFSADKVNTPLLLLHGTVDTNVPIGESIQMFNALRILGKEVEFVQLKDENHGIADPKRRMEWVKSIQAWFARWLKDQPEWWDELYPSK
ncbi:S9 family peptidase [Bacteroidales bacterium OttesenSCG-928-M11]|nr:S9 family peptidase [Bacteroidales bacterium OttesenSCG-928-M11]